MSKCILLQESESSRIVQKIEPFYLLWMREYIIARERKVEFGWKTTGWLYTYQYKTIEDYVRHFDLCEQKKKRKKEKRKGHKQFTC